MFAKQIFAAGLAAMVFAPSIAAAADLACQHIQLKCSGFEPNWAFSMPGNGTIRFTDPENPNFQTEPIVIAVCANHLPGGEIGISTGAPLSLSATVKPQQCTQPSGQVRPLSIAISYKQGAQSSNPMQISGNGCCWH